MASVVTSARMLTRDKLATFLPNQEAIKAFEGLARDIAYLLPNAVDSVAATAAAAALQAAAAEVAANDAVASVEDLVATLNLQLTLLYDPDADPPTFAYLCEAQPGALTADPVWRVQKLTFDVDGGVRTQWASGTAAFDKIADNRASLTYL